jgi:predicted glycosyltransferase
MILFDIVTPKWVLFFKELINKIGLEKVIVTTRYDETYDETKKLLALHKIPYISIGEYGGVTLEGKLKASIDRQVKLIEIVKKYNVKKVVSGSVVDINRVAFGLGIDVINFNDMPMRGHNDFCKEVTHVTKLTAPFSSILFKPFMVPDEVFEKLGVCNIKTYNFLDPLIWLKDFKVDKNYVKEKIPFTSSFVKVVPLGKQSPFL